MKHGSERGFGVISQIMAARLVATIDPELWNLSVFHRCFIRGFTGGQVDSACDPIRGAIAESLAAIVYNDGQEVLFCGHTWSGERRT